MENETMILQCKSCPSGHYAPKMIDFGHFESMPPQLDTDCTQATALGDLKLCSTTPGWHINNRMYIQSNIRGIPQGLKYSIKQLINIRNPFGGKLLLTFKMKNFSPNEYFRVLINGNRQYMSN